MQTPITSLLTVKLIYRLWCLFDLAAHGRGGGGALIVDRTVTWNGRLLGTGRLFHLLLDHSQLAKQTVNLPCTSLDIRKFVTCQSPLQIVVCKSIP